MTTYATGPGAQLSETTPTFPPVCLEVPPQPLARMSADLMPDEVLARRRLGHLKRRLAFVAVAIVVALGLGFALVRQQTARAQSDLSAANQHVATLNQQVSRFQGLVAMQADTQTLTGLLTTAMAGDVGWSRVLAELQRAAPAGLRVIGVAGQTADGTPDAAATSTATSAAPAAGSMTISGTTRSYRAVADYAAALSRIPAFTGVLPATTATAGTGGGLTFTITLTLTGAALSHPPSPSPGTSGSVAPSQPALAAAPGTTSDTSRSPVSTSISKTETTTAARGAAAQLPVGN